MTNPEKHQVPGLYIHVPFCRSKCGYCDFYSETALDLKPLFLKFLPEEMQHYRGLFGAFDSLYFGGGTPSVLAPVELEKILDAVHKYFEMACGSEITLEANPADLNADCLIAVHRLGFGRIDIGVQSFHDAVLDFLGRRHTASDARSAIHHARTAGFDNVGLDLIYGVPGQSMNLWLDTLSEAIAFEPEHLSCYQLTLSSGTPLGRKLQDNIFSLPAEELSLRFFLETAEILESAGYIHYEVSNYARDVSFFSRHNHKYWDHGPYLGLGPGAHSFLRDRRWWNRRSVEAYAKDLGFGRRPVEGEELLTTEDRMLEALFLGLRKKAGLHLGEFSGTYGVDLEKEKKDMLRRLETEGLIHLGDGYLKPTIRGLAVADSLALI